MTDKVAFRNEDLFGAHIKEAAVLSAAAESAILSSGRNRLCRDAHDLGKSVLASYIIDGSAISSTGTGTVKTRSNLRVGEIGEEIPALFLLDRGVSHNATKTLGRNPLRVKTPAQPWAYSVAFEVQPAALGSPVPTDEIVVELDLEVEDGEVYVGALQKDLQEFIGCETKVVAGVGRVRAQVVVPHANLFSWLMIRNGPLSHMPSIVRIYSLSVYRGGQGRDDLFETPPPEIANSLDGGFVSPLIISRLPTTDSEQGKNLDRYLAVLRRKWDEVPAGIVERRRTADLLKLSDQELKTQWLTIHQETTSGDGFSVRGWYQRLYCDALQGKKVLDVGSGLGLDAIAFARAGARMTFLDIVETNQQVIRRLCGIFDLHNVNFQFMETLDSLDSLPHDFDFIWCQGSMLNAPFEYMRIESQALLDHLPVGGRWVELAYPRKRWERDGALPFNRWGEKTDGAGTPWMEWYDLDKWRARMYPAQFDAILDFSFHNDDFCWFDLVRTR